MQSGLMAALSGLVKLGYFLAMLWLYATRPVALAAGFATLALLAMMASSTTLRR